MARMHYSLNECLSLLASFFSLKPLFRLFADSEEAEKPVNGSGVHFSTHFPRSREERRMIDITRDKPIKVTVRVVVPVRDHPKVSGKVTQRHTRGTFEMETHFHPGQGESDARATRVPAIAPHKSISFIRADVKFNSTAQSKQRIYSQYQHYLWELSKINEKRPCSPSFKYLLDGLIKYKIRVWRTFVCGKIHCIYKVNPN
jgi:hypothetical protein